MSNFPRRGRPPRVRETERGFAVPVKGVTYEYKQDANGRLRPINSRDGDKDGRDYAKRVIERHLEG